MHKPKQKPTSELPFGRVGVYDEMSFYGAPVEAYEPMTNSWIPGTVTRVLNGGTLIEIATDPDDPQRTFRYSAKNVRRMDGAARPLRVHSRVMLLTDWPDHHGQLVYRITHGTVISFLNGGPAIVQFTTGQRATVPDKHLMNIGY